MSALSLATLGVICDDRALSMASLGVFCEAITPELPPLTPIPGSGGGRTSPGYGRQREDDLKETRKRRILQEDEEVIALIMSMVTQGLI